MSLLAVDRRRTLTQTRWMLGMASAAGTCVGVLGGCSTYQADTMSLDLVRRGEYGTARERIAAQSPAPNDRNYVLNRMKLLAVSVADGVADATEVNADQVYDLLRTQGLNEDKTVATFLAGEGNTRVYKGEPYEQALAYTYVGIFDGLMGEWGNVRATANDSLFLLRDFSNVFERASEEEAELQAKNEFQPLAPTKVAGLTPEQQADVDAQLQARSSLIAYSARRDKAKASEGNRTDAAASEDAFVTDSKPSPSDYEVGHLFRAIAARHLGERDEAIEAAATLRQVAPRLTALGEAAVTAQYNTVLVVSYGTAPRKQGVGPDRVIPVYIPTTPSDESPLLISLGGGSTISLPVVTDVNRLARDVRWNNLEDMRSAKSAVGSVMVGAGLGVALMSDDSTAQLIGLGVALAGAIMKATAGVDERHNELFPQRLYVALLDVPPSGTTLRAGIENNPASAVVLNGFNGPSEADGLRLAYLRLPMVQEPWATSGQMLYANDAVSLPQPSLPYILGGRCTRTPSEAVMESYYAAGLPRSVTLSELRDLYREEGISVLGESDVGTAGRHVLEGGKWLFTPAQGSLAFARIYGQEHKPYQSSSALARDIFERMLADKSAGVDVSSGTSPSPLVGSTPQPVSTGSVTGARRSGSGSNTVSTDD